jgi:aryl-alcohol dehydrogenase-like predicted oxidoreductase
MRTLTRREFSRLLALSPVAAPGAATSGEIPRRRLGKIGFEAGMLGWGAQHIGLPGVEQTTVDRMAAEAIDSGINYIDTAPNYGQSEERLGRALQGKRNKVFLVTKIESRTRDEAWGQIRESLRRLQTDRLDAVLYHNIGRDDRFPDLDEALSEKSALGALLEARRQGLIGHIGCSTHSFPGRTMKAFETGHFNLFMGVLNFVDRHVYNLEEKILPEARRRGIGVIAMKALGGPVRDPAGARLAAADYAPAMRYVWSLAEVGVAIVGFRTVEELRQGIAAARAFQPLSASEFKKLAERGKLLAGLWGQTKGPVG